MNAEPKSCRVGCCHVPMGLDRQNNSTNFREGNLLCARLIHGNWLVCGVSCEKGKQNFSNFNLAAVTYPHRGVGCSVRLQLPIG